MCTQPFSDFHQFSIHLNKFIFKAYSLLLDKCYFTDGGIIFESMDTEIDNVSIKEDNNDDDEGEMCETHDIPGIDVNSSSHTFHIESGQMDDIMNGSSVSGPTSIIVTTGPSTAGVHFFLFHSS